MVEMPALFFWAEQTRLFSGGAATDVESRTARPFHTSKPFFEAYLYGRGTPKILSEESDFNLFSYPSTSMMTLL